MIRAPDRLRELAAAGRLYPSVILHGGEAGERLALAGEIARTLLCERERDRRPCGKCKHCRRIDLEADRILHPDLVRPLLCEREPDRHPCGECERCRWIDLELVAGRVFRRDCVRELLCIKKPGKRRPCGRCTQCQRIPDQVFHPDVVFARREPRKSDPRKKELVISVDKVRALLQTAQVSPFEARGQVFVIVEAETLHPAGANVLLKTLEEPADRSPRNFLLLASSANELLPTLRSRSLTVYLGAGAGAGDEEEELVADLVELWRQRPGDRAFSLWVSALAGRLVRGGGFEDIRARRCWTRVAGALASTARGLNDRADRAAALALSADLLDAHRLRQRSIRPDRIIEGLAARRLRRDRPETGFASLVNELMGPP